MSSLHRAAGQSAAIFTMTSATYACGSTPLALQVWMTVWIVTARSPPVFEPANSQFRGPTATPGAHARRCVYQSPGARRRGRERDLPCVLVRQIRSGTSGSNRILRYAGRFCPGTGRPAEGLSRRWCRRTYLRGRAGRRTAEAGGACGTSSVADAHDGLKGIIRNRHARQGRTTGLSDCDDFARTDTD